MENVIVMVLQEKQEPVADKIDSRKRDKCRWYVVDQTSSETVNPQTPCLRATLHGGTLGGHHSRPKCAIILHDGNFSYRRTLENF